MKSKKSKKGPWNKASVRARTVAAENTGARKKKAASTDCPGCIKCGPPIVVKADEGCEPPEPE